jgi:SPT2 chromatin protein
MEVDFMQLEREEKYSRKIGRLEDLREMEREMRKKRKV